jgi:hypothetical protein
MFPGRLSFAFNVTTVCKYSGMYKDLGETLTACEQRILYPSSQEEMDQPFGLSSLDRPTVPGRSEPDYFKPLPATPSTNKTPTTPNVQNPIKIRLKRAASVSSWRPPADWIKTSKSSAERPPLTTSYSARSYSLLIPEPLSSTTDVWMESAPHPAGFDPAQKIVLYLSGERPLPPVPDVPRRNPSRLSLREQASQKDNPLIIDSPQSSSQSDISLVEGLSKVSESPAEVPSKSHSDSQLLGLHKSLRILPSDEGLLSPPCVLDSPFNHVSNNSRKDDGDSIVGRPKTGDRGLVPQPLSWRKASSGSFTPEGLCTCSQSPDSLLSGQHQSRKRPRPWVPGDSGEYSKQPECKSQKNQSFSTDSTKSCRQGSSSGPGSNILLTYIAEYGKDIWFHVKQNGSTEVDQTDVSSFPCPLHMNEMQSSPTISVQRANVLLRLPGGFVLVRQSASSTSISKTASVCDILPKEYQSQTDPSMGSQAPTLELPAIRTSWSTHESEVTATSTRAIHNCSRISLGSIRSPESGSTTNISPPSPLAKEFLLPCDSTPSELQPLRSSSSSSAATTKTNQRVDSLVEKTSLKHGLVQNAKSAWKTWKGR